jgi:hypothetical protein
MHFASNLQSKLFDKDSVCIIEAVVNNTADGTKPLTYGGYNTHMQIIHSIKTIQDIFQNAGF